MAPLVTSGAAWLWFIGCYSPLFAIVAIRSWLAGSATIAIAALAVGILSIFSTKVSLSLSDAPIPVEVNGADRRDIDVATYVVTYVVPFALVPTGSPPDILAAVLIFFVVGLIAVSGTTVLPNPSVQVFGYRWMTLVTPGGRLTTLVKATTAEQLAQPSVQIGDNAEERRGRTVRVRHIGSGIWIVGDA